MILRRFMQHAGEQNWFAVAIDVIVVLGSVLLATQISIAIENAKSQRDLESSLRNLSSEISRQIEWTPRAISWEKGHMAGLRDVLAILDGAQPDQYDQDRILKALTFGIDPPTIVNHFPTLDEMSNAGRLKEIPHPGLRGVLIELASISSFSDTEFQRLEASANRSPLQYEFIDREIELNPKKTTWGFSIIKHVDWESARASHDFRMRILQAHDILARTGTRLIKGTQLLEEVKRELKSEGFQPSSSWWAKNVDRVYGEGSPWQRELAPVIN